MDSGVELRALRDQVATLTAVVAERDATIAEQARTLDRVTSELRWHGLDDNALTVSEGFVAFEAARQNDDCWAQYERWLSPLVARYPTLPCLQLGPEKWAEHIALRKKEPCGRWKHHPPSKVTLNHELTAARMMMKYLVDTGRLPRNPLTAAKRLKGPTARESYLPWADIQLLVKHAAILGVDKWGRQQPRRVALFRAFVLTSFGAFLRLEETLPLRRDRISPDGSVELMAKESKGQRRRAVVLPRYAMDAIADVAVLDGDHRIFTHRFRGKVVRLTGQALRNWWHRVCQVSGVDARALDGERIVPHTLRHSGASHADELGAHPIDIMDGMGHTDLGTTQPYLHRRQKDRAVALADLMSRLPPKRAASKSTVGSSRLANGEVR